MNAIKTSPRIGGKCPFAMPQNPANSIAIVQLLSMLRIFGITIIKILFFAK